MKMKNIFIGISVFIMISSVLIINASGKGRSIEDMKLEYSDLKTNVDQKQKEILNAGETKGKEDLDNRLKEGKKFKDDLKYLGELEAQIATPKVETIKEKIDNKFKQISSYLQSELECNTNVKRIEYFKRCLADLNDLRNDYLAEKNSADEILSLLEHFYDNRKFKN
ncbi:MAG TPA: hypothetical protein PK566_07175 [Pseudobacteroides sp.]|nr:hypothetical protein [Pseudobacteroides sp.]